MPVQRSQGRRRPLVPRVDELPDGVPAPARPAPERDAAGRLLPGPGTRALASAAAKAAHESRQLAQLLGLWEVPEDHAYAPYARLAREWRDAHMAQLSASVGGGSVGPGPASVVSSAAMQLAASRYLSDLGARTCDAKLLLDASRLADASRANLLSAHELAAKEAASRPKTADAYPWLAPANPATAKPTRQASPAVAEPAAAIAPTESSGEAQP